MAGKTPLVLCWLLFLTNLVNTLGQLTRNRELFNETVAHYTFRKIAFGMVGLIFFTSCETPISLCPRACCKVFWQPRY